MRQALIAALGVLFFSTVAQAATYGFDPDYTEVRFYYDAQGMTLQSGEWANVTGSADFDGEDLSSIKVSVTVAADSVYTGSTALDNHLKSPDFFEVEKYPTITFESTGVHRSGASSIVLKGNLTIKDITKPVELDVTLNHIGPHPLAAFFDKYKGQWLGITASGTLLRSDWDLGLGAPITGDRIRLEIFSEMKANES